MGGKASLDRVGNLAGRIRSAITGEIPPDIQATMIEVASELDKISRQGQIEINRIETGNTNVFVSGWRPFIGWIGGLSLGMYFIPQFIAANVVWVMNIMSTKTLQAFPVSPDGILELVLGLFGLGALRSMEKIGGGQNNH